MGGHRDPLLQFFEGCPGQRFFCCPDHPRKKTLRYVMAVPHGIYLKIKSFPDVSTDRGKIFFVPATHHFPAASHPSPHDEGEKGKLCPRTNGNFHLIYVSAYGQTRVSARIPLFVAGGSRTFYSAGISISRKFTDQHDVQTIHD